jgi:hypothetical protein
MPPTFKQLCDGERALGSAGQLVSSDGQDFQWITPDGARVYHNASQSIADSAFTILNFNSERYDRGGLHDTVTNNSRLTAQRTGIYIITGHALFDGNANGFRFMDIMLNGVLPLGQSCVPAGLFDYGQLSVSTVYLLGSGDYVELRVAQSSGGNLDVLVQGNTSPEFAMQWLGP